MYLFYHLEQYKMPEEDKSLFNSGLAKLERIHKIRMEIIKFRIEDRNDDWADALGCWRDEMNYGMTGSDKETADKFEKMIEQFLSSESHHPGIKINLKGYTRLLGDVEQKLGLGMPNQGSIFDAALK